ncbi:hypothetical protein JCM6882_002300 [Rhodosporidiobolus microsporus]
MEDRSAGPPTALQRALAAHAALSAAVADLSPTHPTVAITCATLLKALKDLLPAYQESTPALDTPTTVANDPATTFAAVVQLPPRPPHLPPRPSDAVCGAAAALLSTTADAATTSARTAPIPAASDKFASQLVLSTRALSAADRASFDLNPAALTAKLRAALLDTPAPLTSARRLGTSGDLLLHFPSAPAAAVAAQAAPTWLPRLHPALTLATPDRTHACVLHRVPLAIGDTYFSSAVEAVAGTKTVKVERIRSRNEGAELGSVKVVLERSEGVGRLLELDEGGGVILCGARVVVERWDTSLSLRQCFRCADWGHKARKCKWSPRCRSCGGSHELKVCNSQIQFCIHCEQSVPSWHKECPRRGKPLPAQKRKALAEKSNASSETQPVEENEESPAPVVPTAAKEASTAQAEAGEEEAGMACEAGEKSWDEQVSFQIEVEEVRGARAAAAAEWSDEEGDDVDDSREVAALLTPARPASTRPERVKKNPPRFNHYFVPPLSRSQLQYPKRCVASAWRP